MGKRIDDIFIDRQIKESFMAIERAFCGNHNKETNRTIDITNVNDDIIEINITPNKYLIFNLSELNRTIDRFKKRKH